MDNFIISVSEAEIAKEKQKARELRKSRWWKDKINKAICEYCGQATPASELTMDHIVPLVRGGKSVKNNIAAACKDCNNKKKYLLPMEWEDYLKNKQ
jgi:5-methylcytosine-specific restriction endonuclease McrA